MNTALLKKKQDAIFQIDMLPAPKKARNFRININVKANEMVASVQVVTNDAEECNVTEFDILNRLYTAGVRIGLYYDRITDIVEQKQFNEDVSVARGYQPEKGADAVLEPQVELEEFTTAEFLKQFPGQRIVKGVPVELDDPILIKIPADPGTAGFTVRGRMIKPTPGEDVDFEVAENVIVDPDKLTVRAAMPGLAGLSEGKIAVRDHEYDAWKYKINFRKDNMEALLTVIPGMTKQPELDESWYMNFLNNKDIKFGINRDGWRFIPKNIRSTYVATVAEGEPAMHGDKAEIIPHFRKGASPDQHIYKVAKGDLIIEKEPARKGAKGRNVLDEPIIAPDGADLEIVPGDNTTLSEDGLKLTANMDGYLSVRDGAYHIVEGMEVDPKAKSMPRKMNFDGVIRVMGPVPRGHSLIAGHHIEVMGDARDAEIIAGGALHIRGALIGAVAQAGGSIFIDSATKSRINTQGNIYIHTNAQNSELISAGGIFPDNGALCSLSGGRAFTGKGAEFKNLGGVSRPSTLIYAGAPFPLRTRYDQLARTMVELINRFERVNAEFARLHKLIKARKVTKPDIIRFKKLQIGRETLKEKIRIGRAQVGKLLQAIHASSNNVDVIARDQIYQGVSITIGTKAFHVEKPMKNKTFVFNKKSGAVEFY